MTKNENYDLVNKVEINSEKTLMRLLRTCYNVYGYVILKENIIGRYIKLQKTDLINELKTARNVDLNKFTYDATNNCVYVG
tara:strand:- start:103 stop:345 length:243 start_codon:yes stop_codon:yes gene_type:complete